MAQCHFCGGKLNWDCDYDYSDYGLEGDGVVATLTCTNCGAQWEGYSNGFNPESVEEEEKNNECK